MQSPRRFQLERLESRSLLSAIPVLHSYPEAEFKIFLDFDGHIVQGTTWNLEFSTIHAPPFDVDGILYENGLPTFNEAEVSRIVSIWERMAEDFRPFNVDVTTEDPSVTEPDIFHVGARAQRILFTSKFDTGAGGTGAQWFARQTLGTAADSWYSGRDTPAWVFSTNPLAGEIGTHEVGHTVGLEHDGANPPDGERIEYRGEHGSGETRWSPIMGQGNGLSQWSRGEYPDATNNENDVGVLLQAFGRRPDDYMSITPLVIGDKSLIEVEGVIGTDVDTDVFSFEVVDVATHVRLDILPWHNGPNLDVGVSLLGLRQGLLIGTSDTDVNPIDALASSIDVVLEPDTYFLTVKGVGKAAVPGDPGYSDYGSLGYYRIVGSIGKATLAGDIDLDGVVSANDIDTLYATIGVATTPGSVSSDLNADGEVSLADVGVLVRDIFGTEFGDFDLNGRVDFADFVILSANYGTSGKSWGEGDATGDGTVDFADFVLLADHFGFGAGRGGL